MDRKDGPSQDLTKALDGMEWYEKIQYEMGIIQLNMGLHQFGREGWDKPVFKHGIGRGGMI